MRETPNSALSRVFVDRRFGQVARGERVFVLSGLDVKRRVTPDLLAAIRRARSLGCPIGAPCSGAYMLARAGLLEGRRAAVHWQFHDSFLEEFPGVALVRNVFVADEAFITASGGTAIADLMLHLIERSHGHDLAVEVADQMVYNAVREASAEQRVSLQSRHGIRNRHLARAIRLMSDTIESPLPPGEIAGILGISARQLERLFGRYLNCSPKKYHMDMRLQKARHPLVPTEMPVTEIRDGQRIHLHEPLLARLPDPVRHHAEAPARQDRVRSAPAGRLRARGPLGIG